MDGTTKETRGIQAEPNVTPMIDVLMVLLIIFMFAVPSSGRATHVQLPVPQQRGEGDAIVLEVGPGGRRPGGRIGPPGGVPRAPLTRRRARGRS